MQLSKLIPNIKLSPKSDVDILAVTTDSRKVTIGSLFLAYPGLTHDGRSFINQAIHQGASAICYEDDGPLVGVVANDIPIIAVPNLQQQVGLIAAEFFSHPSEHLQMIGVTGTNGKTSVTQFIAQALTLLGESCGVLGTLGNGLWPELVKTIYTTPSAVELQQTLLNFYHAGANSVAMEVSSHALDQGRVNGVNFNTAVFTNLSRDHLDYHGSMENYAKAKTKLFKMPGLKNAVINYDDPLGRKLTKKTKADVICYSLQPQTDTNLPFIQASKISALDNGFEIKVNTPWGEGEFTTALLGRFNLSNLLAVLGVLCLHDIPFNKALLILSQLTTVDGRMQCFGGGEGRPLTVIDYSHTPDSLLKALTALREHCRGKLWCVFGCGGDRDRGKRPEMGKIAMQYADCTIVTNDNPRTESPQQILKDIVSQVFEREHLLMELDRAKAIQYAVQNADVGDVVLIAGKGHERVQIIGEEKIPFSDREQVELALKRFPA